MAVFGTSQGTPKPTVLRSEKVGSMPSGAAPGAGERTTPVATSVGQPNSQPIK